MSLKIGDRATLSKTVTAKDVEQFALITGDTNPLHLDQTYAAKTRFGGRVAHGMLGASLISAVLGTKLGGPIYLGQTLKFAKPIWIGDTITATAEVISADERKYVFTIRTRVTNQEGIEVIVGEATVRPLFAG